MLFSGSGPPRSGYLDFLEESLHAAGYDLREPSTGELMLLKGPQRPNRRHRQKDPHKSVLCTSPNSGPAVVGVGSLCSDTALQSVMQQGTTARHASHIKGCSAIKPYGNCLMLELMLVEAFLLFAPHATFGSAPRLEFPEAPLRPNAPTLLIPRKIPKSKATKPYTLNPRIFFKWALG